MSAWLCIVCIHRRPFRPSQKHTKMKAPTHLLVVRTKSSNRLHVKAEFESKSEAFAASTAILRANPDRFVCEISHISR